jgi:hypothetical protein
VDVNEASDKRSRSPHALFKRKIIAELQKSIENSNVDVTFLVIAGWKFELFTPIIRQKK